MGRGLGGPLFDWCTREVEWRIFTATRLSVVVGVALMMQSAACAGRLAHRRRVVLAESAISHELEATSSVSRPAPGALLHLGWALA